jgi:hypothetical protein
MRFAAFPPRAARPARRLDLRDPRPSRDATHTLRRTPLVGSRTASPRPLPSCRCRSPRAPLRDRHASRGRSPDRRPARSVPSAFRRSIPRSVPYLAGLASPADAGPALSRGARRSSARWERAPPRLARHLAVGPLAPAGAGVRFAISRLRLASDPEIHDHLGHSRALDRGPAPTRGPVARCERPSSHWRGLGAGLGFARRGAVRCRCDAPARSTAEWPTSRPCSADESVAIHPCCQRWNALSFHGLCSPSRSSFTRSSHPWCLRRGRGSAPRRSATHLVSGIPPAVALLRSRRTGLGLALRRSLSGLRAAVPPPRPPRCPRAPARSGARRRRPSWGL